MSLIRVCVGLAVATALAVTAAAAHAAPVVLSVGHVDAIAPVHVDGALQLKVKDGTGEEEVLRDPADVVLHAKPQSRMAVPEDLPPGYEFLGAPGSDVWILPEIQDPDLLWPGWSSEDLPHGLYEGDELTWSLDAVEGPGPVQLFDTGPVGDPRVFFDSADPAPDSETRPVGTHAHFTWVFHHEGMYRLRFTVAGNRPDGTTQSTSAVLRVFVGELSELPPETVSFDNLQLAYEVGTTVTLNAHQHPASAFDAYRWLRQCHGEDAETQVATGPSYTFTVAAAHDGCRLTLVLDDHEGKELLRSDSQAIYVDPGHYGPRRIISRGHIDALNVRLQDGRLVVVVKDGSADEVVLRDPDKVLLHAKPAAALQLPDGLPDSFGFLGTAGATIWLLPETQDDAILWPGWETYELGPGVIAGDELDWTLLSVDGPGAMHVWMSDAAGEPHVIFDSARGLPQAATMGASTHAHANWSFTAPGLYKLRFQLDGTLAGTGEAVTSGPVEYWFHVGDLAALPPYPDDVPPPAPGDDPAPDPPATPAPQPAPAPTAAPVTAPGPSPSRQAPSLALERAAVRGRTLSLGMALESDSRVTISVWRRGRWVTRAAPRRLAAGRRDLRVRIGRRLRPGARYAVHVIAKNAQGRTVRRLTFRVPDRAMR